MIQLSVLVALTDALPGMVLADDLRDSWGHILLPQGAKLTEATLTSLQRYDIDLLPIVSEELNAAEAAAEKARQQQRLEVLFRKSSGDKAAALLQQYVSEFRRDAHP